MNVTIRCTKEERECLKKIVHNLSFHNERTMETILRVLRNEQNSKLVKFNDKDYIFKG